jgi:hypothetical protein
LLDTLVDPVEMALHVLLDVYRLAVDLCLQAIQAAVGDGEFLPKVFTELIDACAHVGPPVAS